MPKTNNNRRADGRVQAKVYLGDGKYKYIYASNNKELAQKVNAVKLKLGKGLDVMAERDTFKEWADIWLANKQIEISNKRYVSYTGSLKHYESIYAVPIVKIRAADIQQIITAAYKDGMSYQTLVQIRSVCKQVFDIAIANRVCDYNPASAVHIPKAAPEETKRALTPEEQAWISAPSEHKGHLAAMVMMYAGLRRGELMALTWRDIDTNACTININKAIEMVDGKPTLKHCGKTDAATRIIHIPNVLADYLATVQHTDMLVCPSAHGVYMSDTGWKRMWESYMGEINRRFGDFGGLTEIDKNGKRVPLTVPKSKFAPKKLPMVIPPITAHWLRHTFITLMYLAGVDVMTAKEQAGHADVKTTMQIYTHLDSKYKVSQISKLNDYLSDGCQMGVKIN